MRAASRRFMPRVPSLPHPDDLPKFKPRVPSAQHPDDLAKELEAERRRKEGVVKRFRKRVGKQIQKKHACERACMCALAVSLLWLTSLVVAKEIVQFFVPTPTVNSVVSAGERLYDNAVQQRAAYENCALLAASSCRSNYDLESTDEADRTLLVQSSVESRLQAIKSELLTCSGAFENATSVFNYSFGDVFPTYVFTTGGTDGICGDFEFSTLVSQQVKAADALAEIEAFKGKSDAAVEDLNNQLAARAAYDLEYLDNKTNGAFTNIANSLLANLTSPEEFVNRVDQQYAEMMACVAETGRFTRLNGAVVPCNETSIFGKARVQFNAMNGQYQTMLADARNFRNSAEAKLARYRSLFNRVTDIINILQAGGFGTAGLFLSGIGLDFADVLSSVLGPQFSSLYDLVPNPDEIYADTVLAAQQIRDSTLANAGVLDATNALYEGDTTKLIQSIFSDYDPPPVDRNASNEEYDGASQGIVGEVASQLNAVATDEDGNPSTNKFREAASINASEASGQLLQKADPREWAKAYLYEDSIFNRLQDGLLRMNDWALLLDYAYRIVRSLMLIRKYWNISAINTPPADVRTKLGISEGTFKAKQNIIQRMGKLATHPGVNLALLFLFIGLFSAAFYAAYSPLYDQYTGNCVDRCFTEIKNDIVTAEGTKAYETVANGTMLYRNAFALAEQYAFADGDYVANTEVDAINVEAELTCSESTVDSIKVEINQDDRLQFYNERQADVIRKVQYVRECVNVAGIEAALAGGPSGYEAALGLELNALLLPTDGGSPHTVCVNTYVSHEAYVAANVVTPNGDLGRIFNCSSVSACDFACAGPNEAILRGVSFESACTAEWYFHATTMGVMMTTIIFIIINISRLVFMNGVVKIYWRHLSSHKFSFLASCAEDGTVIYPEAVTKDGLAFRKVIIKQLRIALRKFEAVGWLITLTGIGMNIPWLSVLIVLKENLQFDSNKICD